MRSAFDGLVHSIVMRDGEVLRAALTDYLGRRWILLRLYFCARDGAWRPTTNGVTVPAEFLGELELALAGVRRAVDSEPPQPARPVDRYTPYNRAREGGGGPCR